MNKRYRKIAIDGNRGKSFEEVYPKSDMNERPEYNPDCPACLRGLPHYHDQEWLQQQEERYLASLP